MAFARRALHRPAPSVWDDHAPIRQELFSVERLESHAHSLAASQPVTPKPSIGRPLTARLADNAALLLDAHRDIVRAVNDGQAITPPAEWLLDNYYQLEEQIGLMPAALPAAYYRQLPTLADGPFAGYPRVFGLVWAFVAHTDSHFEPEVLSRYVRAYQEVQPLTIGELWAVAITLRLVLVEELGRVAAQIVEGRGSREAANRVADRLLGARGGQAEPVPAVLADLARAPLLKSFAVQLAHRLRDQDPRITPALTWLDERLAAQGTTTDAIVREEHQRLGVATVTVRNVITSMQLIAEVDWTELFESMSLVDEVLDTAGGFADMDFPTRDLYRRAVEQLARGSQRTELDVARGAALAATQAAATSAGTGDDRAGDPGYYLVAGGRSEFERSIEFHAPLRSRFKDLSRALGIRGYTGAIAVMGAILLALPLAWLANEGLGGAWLLLLGALGAIPATDVAVALVNGVVSRSHGATPLPALELRDGIPGDLRTLVVIPTLLDSPGSIAQQIERLEIHHLASPGGELHFALLADPVDADTEHGERDDGLLAVAAEGIARLNERYGRAAGGERFLLLPRHRVWNEGEGCWIAWERKRGKLRELNRLLRGATDTTFLDAGGSPPAVPADVRYVITLDADTKLPREAVRRLIGKMAHPLNRPRFDAAAGRVVEGYAVLQPRVTPSLPVGREGSLFQRIFSSMSGIDPYASAVSDVYQDLFGEGSYTGKGIYDVDAFEEALAAPVPDSTLLSHDLFEGVFARAGLASDVEVVEEFPARYDVAASRHHRWARGDWQLLPWIFGRGPGPHGDEARSAIPAVGRWKLLDNLRRTLSAPAGVAALLVGLLLPLPAALAWTAFVLATLALPTLIPLAGVMMPRRPGITTRSQLRALGVDLRLAVTLSFLRLAFLAHQAWLMGDAIGRTLVRLFVTHRHLLEWVPAARATIDPRLGLPGFYRRMRGAVIIAALAVIIAVPFGDGTWPLALVLGVLWVASPAIALWASVSPLAANRLPVSASDARELELTARRTWRYFETFVTAGDHMLPPDNFQEDPAPAVAHRTSPTNLGLYLLSIVSARDFGWIGTLEAIDRLEATLATMASLARFRGHFYNWYDTGDLRPLDPPYISSVDSGNLAGHLIALAGACREWRVRPLADERRLAGIGAAVELTRDEAAHLRDGRRTQTVTWRQFDDAHAGLAADVSRAAAPGERTAERLAGLATQADTVADIARAMAIEQGEEIDADLLFWAEATRGAIAAHRRDLGQSPGDVALGAARLAALEDAARATAMAMEFDFLLDHDRQLLAIGYSVAEGTFDPNCYDLLASEARLASFVAIAKDDVPARHWFHLGRAATPIAHGAALISWSGSMFEYLMPSLIMRAPADSLIEGTSRLVVRRQIDYGDALGLPWGVSECAYNARGLDFAYQYSSFGIPGLGLKRGLSENAVVAPYATALAAMVEPHAAAANFARLAATGARGRYGFYEALDFTPARIPDDQRVAIVRAFMAHHQGMTIVAIADALLDGVMRERFHAEPLIQATELLLQERIPRDVAITRPWPAEATAAVRVREFEPSGDRQFDSARGATPATHLLSNGRYAVMLTAAGSGYSHWGDLAVTRWRPDPTCDDWGSYVFLRDVDSGVVWSAGYQPTGAEPDTYHVAFTEDRAVFTRRDGTLTTTMDVLVSPEDDAEVRRVSVVNSGSATREIEFTSYAEVVLAPQAADSGEPIFSKLFVETEYLPDVGAIVATRRRRTPDEPTIWAAHLAVVAGDPVGQPQVETDRARFLGRGRDVRSPIATIDQGPLSHTVGAVLDPVFALRYRMRIAPGTTAVVAFWTVAAPSRDAVLELADKHRDTTAFDRVAALGWTQAQIQLHHLAIGAGEASLFQRLAGHLLYPAQALRPSSDTIRDGLGGQAGLWAHGISGDLPIVLLRLSDGQTLGVARQLLQAHEYWRMKQLPVDVVLLNERVTSYTQDLQLALEALVRTSQARSRVRGGEPPGRVFVLRSDLISAETRALLASVARVVLVGERGRLSDQLDRVTEAERSARPPRRSGSGDPPEAAGPAPDLEFFNGLGGFADDGKEYVTVLGPSQSTPAPWINVVANPAFGFQVATEGSGSTWSLNSREHQVTARSSDPVSDRPGEVIYLHDDDTGDLWGPTALPIRDEAATYVARHGRGYSRFEHAAHGIASDLVQYVPMDDPIKISRLVLRNTSNRVRHLSVTAYVEWVLGRSRESSAPFIATEIDADTGAMFARNAWNPAFGSRVAFADLGGRQTDWTGNRREFIGRNGTLASPSALGRGAPLSRNVGAGLDPCGALRTRVELPAHGSIELLFLLGEAESVAAARTLVTKYRTADLDAVRSEVDRYWADTLEAVQVRTPDRAMDLMLNGWLLYQTVACRLWARSAFYQASGAYGFRDQLQDGMAIATARPLLAREHLLRAASRQFVEGDVQHWWLPLVGQGSRTRISDDRAWLAYTIAQYVDATGDAAVLDEWVSFLEGPKLTAGEQDAAFEPTVSDEFGTLFEHGARALDHSLALGRHGLPLMGTGDWNDGMNRVGELGEGESVWLGWFLHAALSAFIPLAIARGETARAATWQAHITALQGSLEREAWDGEWYRRAYFDDGTPLGSATNEECRIDSISQSWAVISGAGTPEHAARAMASLERELLRPNDGLALLLAPPFDRTPLDPGYIKGYPPGIRENGGQYTHAALWVLLAFAALREGEKAAALFSLLNPIHHTRSRADVHRYKVEPYVVTADVSAAPPHVGRGGWTWYTGSAGWMQRAGIEGILGMRLHGASLQLDPCIPEAWPSFEIALRYGTARYEIRVENPDHVGGGIASASLDGREIAERPPSVPLADDGATHRFLVRLG